MPTVTDEEIRSLLDEDLLWQIAEGHSMVAGIRAYGERLEYEVIQRATARGAKAIITERFTAELEANVTYDQSRFTPLLEILPEEGVKDAYVPEHEEMRIVPAKWNTQKAIKWANKVGDKALNIIADARLEGAPRVKLTEKAPVDKRLHAPVTRPRHVP